HQAARTPGLACGALPVMEQGGVAERLAGARPLEHVQPGAGRPRRFQHILEIGRQAEREGALGQDAAALWKLEQEGVSASLRKVTADLLDQKSMLEAHAKVVEEDRRKEDEATKAMQRLGDDGVKGLHAAEEASIKLFEALEKSRQVVQGGLVAPLKELVTAPVQPFGGALP